MNRKKTILIALLFGLLLIPTFSVAQAQTRISFRRGAVRADVSGTLNNFRSKRTYVIRVR
jgi:hypothetical protein